MSADAPLETIDVPRARAALAARGVSLHLVALAECPSTNDVAARAVRDGAPLPLAAITDFQSAGRGRQGAPWLSPRGASLPFSIARRFTRTADRMGGLSLAIGVACAEALDECGVRDVRLKWPNDLLIDGRKLGGILVETRVGAGADDARATLVVAGVGINVALPPDAGERLGRRVASVAEFTPAPPDMTTLFVALAASVDAALARFEQSGFAPFHQRWEARHAWQGEAVRVMRDGRIEREGLATGVADDGALIITTAAGSERVHAAEISLARAG